MLLRLALFLVSTRGLSVLRAAAEREEKNADRCFPPIILRFERMWKKIGYKKG
jgi:hypothetical protein